MVKVTGRKLGLLGCKGELEAWEVTVTDELDEEEEEEEENGGDTTLGLYCAAPTGDSYTKQRQTENKYIN